MRQDDLNNIEDLSSQDINLKKVFFDFMQVMKEKGLLQEDLISMYAGSETLISENLIPVGVFAEDLSPSESLCKYLKENADINYKKIAALLNRDERSIWTSYNRSLTKMQEKFSDTIFSGRILVPISVFSNRNLSILESLVLYLRKNTDLTNYGIAKLLNKTPSMIYTIYDRAVKKQR